MTDTLQRTTPLAVSDLAARAVSLSHVVPERAGQLARSPRERTSLCLLATDEYDAWLLHWPVSTSVTPHDHGESAGAFTVVSGELTEVRWHGFVRRARLLVPGEVVAVPAGVVHDVIAPGPSPALSVHVYSPPLREMGFYDASGRELIDRQAVSPAPVTDS